MRGVEYEYKPGWRGAGTGTWSLPVQTLENALAYMRNKAWTQGAFMRDREGGVLLGYEDEACCDFNYLAEGALGRIAGVSANGFLMLGAVRAGCIFGMMFDDATAGALLAIARCGVDDLRGWNDAPERRKRDVRGLFERALDVARGQRDAA